MLGIALQQFIDGQDVLVELHGLIGDDEHVLENFKIVCDGHSLLDDFKRGVDLVLFSVAKAQVDESLVVLVFVRDALDEVDDGLPDFLSV